MQRLRLAVMVALVAILGQSTWAQSVYEVNSTFPAQHGAGLPARGSRAASTRLRPGIPPASSLAFNGLLTTPGRVSGAAFNRSTARCAICCN